MRSFVRIVLVGIGMFVATLPARPSTVTLCHRDNEAGAGVNGVNLDTALQTGGTVIFSCAFATIQITHTHVLSKSVNIQGSGITLDAGGRTLTMFQVGAAGLNLVFKNLTLINAVAGNTGALPALSPASIIHSGFSGNVTITLDSVEIDNSERPVYAVGDNTVTLNILHTQFRNNRGAAVYIQGANASITQSSFVGNEQAVFVAGKLTAEGATFADSRLSAVSVGVGGTAILSHCQFNNNNGSDGAGITINGKAKSVAVESTDFTSNTGDGRGGAVGIYPFRRMPPLPTPAGAVLVRLRYVTFTGNSAGADGGIEGAGGAIWADLSDGGQMLIYGGLFQDNMSTGDGGALYSSGGSVVGNALIFKNNTAAKRGSAAFVVAQANTPAYLGNLLAISNQAGSGGGAVTGSNLNLENTTIADNAAGGIGSADRTGMPAGPIGGTNNIILRNSPSNCTGSFSPAAVNLQFPGDAACGAVTVAEPALDTMYAPLPGSAAYGKGDLATCLGPAVAAADVLFHKRGTNQSCSMGAIEYWPEKELRFKARHEGGGGGNQHP